jgi:plastocyanin domain-containing protein
MKNIGTIIIIGLLAWWFLKGQKQTQASTSAAAAPATLSEWDLLHTTVPITGYETKEIQVFP